jgi:hypothetical protein
MCLSVFGEVPLAIHKFLVALSIFDSNESSPSGLVTAS